jgi:hypothetical protein
VFRDRLSALVECPSQLHDQCAEIVDSPILELLDHVASVIVNANHSMALTRARTPSKAIKTVITPGDRCWQFGATLAQSLHGPPVLPIGENQADQSRNNP